MKNQNKETRQLVTPPRPVISRMLTIPKKPEQLCNLLPEFCSPEQSDVVSADEHDAAHSKE